MKSLLLSRKGTWNECFNWPNQKVSTVVMLCSIFTQRKANAGISASTRKGKNKCLHLCLGLRQVRFHSEIRPLVCMVVIAYQDSKRIGHKFSHLIGLWSTQLFGCLIKFNSAFIYLSFAINKQRQQS